MEEKKYLQELFLVINRHILDQSTSNECPLECPFLNLRHKHKKREFGKLSNMTWFLRVGARGFEPAPSAPKALNIPSAALGLQAMTIFLHGSA